MQTPNPFSRQSMFLPYPSGMDLDGYLGFWRDLDAAGWEAAWTNEVIDHDPYAILAVVASQTSQIRIGTSVSTWTRTVPTLAASAATVDVISGGRFRLGLGTMPREWNRDWHGIAPERLVRRMQEYVEGIRVAWNAWPDPASYPGELVGFTGLRRAWPLPRTTIPIYLGVSGPQLIRLAGRLADGVLMHSCYTMETLQDVTLPILAEGARAAGRSLDDIDLSLTVSCCVSEDRAEAIHWAKAQCAWYTSFDYNRWVFDHMGWSRQAAAASEAWKAGDKDRAIAAIDDDIVFSICLAGTADDVRRQARDKFGDLRFLPRIGTPTESPPDFKAASMRRLIEVFAP